MPTSPYDLLAEEYYDTFHKTCRNFDASTKVALRSHPPHLPNSGLILEVGCGRGRCGEFLSIDPARVVQLDSSATMLQLIEREQCILRIHADATSIPLLAQQFSGVVGFLIDAFAGLPFLCEAFRVLGPGGRLLLTTPTPDWGYTLRGDQEPAASRATFQTRSSGTVTVPPVLISKDQWERLLTEVGFEGISVTEQCLATGAQPVSPDIEIVATRRHVNVYDVPIIHLITATKPSVE